MDNFEKACSALKELKEELIISYPTPRHWLDRLLNRYGWYRKPEKLIIPGGTIYILTQTSYRIQRTGEKLMLGAKIKKPEVLGKCLAVKPSVAKRIKKTQSYNEHSI